ncbi:MAG: hypothetical protein NXY57DRAFT_243899 [Lentinula lateritia]|nr:MAG: hypothetical protein NXY57DRAFT_243899 [Lentinula lateritia]
MSSAQQGLVLVWLNQCVGHEMNDKGLLRSSRATLSAVVSFVTCLINLMHEPRLFVVLWEAGGSTDLEGISLPSRPLINRFTLSRCFYHRRALNRPLLSTPALRTVTGMSHRVYMLDDRLLSSASVDSSFFLGKYEGVDNTFFSICRVGDFAVRTSWRARSERASTVYVVGWAA